MLCYLNHVNDLSWIDRRKNVKSLFFYIYFFTVEAQAGFVIQNKEIFI